MEMKTITLPFKLTRAKPTCRLVFDGGSKGNPGRGYGSYAIKFANDLNWTVTHVDFHARMTNNEAEYEALLAGLQNLQTLTAEKGIELSQTLLEIAGDSQLVIFQLKGEWKAREPRLIARREKAWAQLSPYSGVRLIHHPRIQSVRLLGH
jgi:ribonuclease HI